LPRCQRWHRAKGQRAQIRGRWSRDFVWEIRNGSVDKLAIQWSSPNPRIPWRGHVTSDRGRGQHVGSGGAPAHAQKFFTRYEFRIGTVFPWLNIFNSILMMSMVLGAIAFVLRFVGLGSNLDFCNLTCFLTFFSFQKVGHW